VLKESIHHQAWPAPQGLAWDVPEKKRKESVEEAESRWTDKFASLLLARSAAAVARNGQLCLR
jgi:hypothetical protein